MLKRPQLADVARQSTIQSQDPKIDSLSAILRMVSLVRVARGVKIDRDFGMIGTRAHFNPDVKTFKVPAYPRSLSSEDAGLDSSICIKHDQAGGS